MNLDTAIVAVPPTALTNRFIGYTFDDLKKKAEYQWSWRKNKALHEGLQAIWQSQNDTDEYFDRTPLVLTFGQLHLIAGLGCFHNDEIVSMMKAIGEDLVLVAQSVTSGR